MFIERLAKQDAEPARPAERQTIRSLSPVFAPRPFGYQYRRNLRQLQFDKTLGYEGEGPSSGDSSDSDMQRWLRFLPGALFVARSLHAPSHSSSEEDMPPLLFSPDVAPDQNLPSSNVGSEGYQPPLLAENVVASPKAQPGRLRFVWPRVNEIVRYLGLGFQSACSSQEQVLPVDHDPPLVEDN